MRIRTRRWKEWKQERLASHTNQTKINSTEHKTKTKTTKTRTQHTEKDKTRRDRQSQGPRNSDIDGPPRDSA